MNSDFFATWTPEMAYVLGLFCADGSISRRKDGRYLVYICSSDRDIIEKVALLLDLPLKSRPRVRKGDGLDPLWWVFTINDKVSSDILHLGVPLQKSKNLSKVDVPGEFFSSFLRGYVDGDGSISKGQRKPAVALTAGSADFLTWVREELRPHVVVTPKVIKDKRRASVFYLFYSGSSAVKLLRYLDYTQEPAMDRKRVRAQQILEESTETVSARSRKAVGFYSEP